MTTIDIAEVSRHFGATPVLQDVSLRLGPGVTGLLGPNGAGKTTLLRILATVLPPDEGSMRVLGHDPAGTGRTHRRPPPSGVPAPGAGLPARLHAVPLRRLHGRPQGVVRPGGTAR